MSQLVHPLVNISLHMNNRAAYKPTCWHVNVKKFVGICLKQLHSRIMQQNTSEKANMLISRLARGQLSLLDTQQSAKVTQRVSTIFSLAQKDAYSCSYIVSVGVRTDSYDVRHGQVSQHAHWHSTQCYMQYAMRVCTSVLFIILA